MGRSRRGEMPHSAAVCAGLDLHAEILAPLSSTHTTVSSVYMSASYGTHWEKSAYSIYPASC